MLSIGFASLVELKKKLKYLKSKKTQSCRKVSESVGGKFRYILFQ